MGALGRTGWVADERVGHRVSANEPGEGKQYLAFFFECEMGGRERVG